MLKLDRLELSGFKSFVDPVELRFAGGVTGIVGPNGCGKSNLSDAITWVLGEQSAKSMRGETMEDVIFAGSENRKPLGLGEVTVTFLAPAGFPHSEEGRITISRRVFRSGESQYRINGKLTRLKEIKDLLMDTGLGVRAYSVIEQGKIGMILSGKPQERRRLIEEAAGVTRYKARKKVAEVKLEEAAANLLRLDDILSEVERNLRSLKRQAGAARRYQERRAEHRELERRVLAGRWAALAREIAEVRSALSAAQDEEARLAAELSRGEAELAAAREAVERRADEVAESTRRQAELSATIEGRQQFLAGALRTADEIDARRTSGRDLARRFEHQLRDLRLAQEEIAAARTALVGDHDVATRAVAADGESVRLADLSVRETEAALESHRRELLESHGRLNEARHRLHREQIEIEKGVLRERHLAEEQERQRSDLDATNVEIAALESRLSALAEELRSGSAGLESARRELERTLGEEQRIGDRLRALEAECATALERRRLLADLARDEPERDAAFLARLAAAGLPQTARLRDRVHALRGWERSLDHFLGPWLEAVLLPAASSALDLLGGGPAPTAAGFVLRLPEGARPPAPPPEDAAIVASLAEALGLADEWAAALPPAYLVLDAADALRLASAHPGVSFLTPEPLWAQAGLLALAGDAAHPGFLARARELAELERELPRLEDAARATREELAERVGARALAAESIRRFETGLAVLRQEEAATLARRDTARAHRATVAAAVEAQERELQRLREELARAGTLQGDLEADLARVEALHAARETRFDELQAEAALRRGEREALRESGAGRRGQLDLLLERLTALDQQSARLGRDAAATVSQLEAWRAEESSLASRRSDLVEATERAERELQEALEARAGGDSLVRNAQEELEAERAGVRTREAALAAARGRHDEGRSAVAGHRVTLAGLEHDEAHLAGEIRDRTGSEPPEVPGELPDDLDLWREELARLAGTLEAMGPVNVLAAEELGAEEERQKFLSTQRHDVAKSVESLRQTIREINQTSGERFREAFAAVNAEFGRTFVQLFRGGEAEMRLLDEEDLLESGIEIVARPPGKRLQNLMLLSGGEKALTAIALLFALFRIKPSPFCILDEVDAPLDDVNTLRFVAMLRELAEETQCIVITHNKLTMEVAGTLYGVTMEERGVSKLIQVALEEVHPLPAGARAGGLPDSGAVA